MASEQPSKRSDLIYFCDESSFIGEEYMAVAGLAISRGYLRDVVAELKAIREGKKMRGEIKWQSTRTNGVDVRKAYIDYLITLISDNKVHFHVRFSPMNEYDHGGKRHIFDTVSKMFYQLLLHRPIRYYGKDCQLHIRPDNGECTSLLPGLKTALLTDGQFRYKSDPNCIESIIPQNSKSEPMLQFLDVVLGALTAYRNGRHLLPTGGAPKRELAEYAFKAFHLKNLTANYDNGNRLSIWNVIPKQRGP